MARTTIYLDDSLRAQLERVVPARGKNRFINEAVREKMAAVVPTCAYSTTSLRACFES
jgi:Arc/MetJ family transcription regulator